METATEILSSKRLSKEVLVGWLSSFSEAYNMALFSFLAPWFAHLLFFTPDGILQVYMLALLGALVFYPLGGLFFGWLGDRKGRQACCMYSTLGLALATGAMGLIPLNSAYGWLFILIFLSAQHFFSGGEYQGAIIFSLEHGAKESQGLLSAFSGLFAVVGLVMASTLTTFTFLKESVALLRLCFLIGGLFGMVAFLYKYVCKESPIFLAMDKDEKKISLKSILSGDWLKLLKAIAVFAFFLVSYNFIFIFLPLIRFEPAYRFTTSQSLILYGLFLLGSGLVSDKLGIQKTMRIGLISFTIFLLPACFWIKQLAPLQMILAACASLVIGPLHGWMVALFAAERRCRSICVSTGIATALFLGSSVPICLFFYRVFHSLSVVALYPLVLSLSALLALSSSKKRIFQTNCSL